MAQIEYDEGSGTFTYFLVLLYGLFVLILTYFLWPRTSKDSDKDKLICQCGPCCRKRTKLEKSQTFSKLIKYVKILLLIVFWMLLILLLYWALTQERETVEWDPYEILQIDRGATTAEIRKQYRLLSKTYHPDKGGDPEVFTKIAKAYEALTDDEAKENWEKYGNPDGPRAATFGIALPSWIVDKNNSLWVLGMYVLVFMVVLPVIVGAWWYRSVKFGTTNILIKTSQFYFVLLSRAKTIPLKRILMILTTAIEFSNKQQAGVKDRPSDDIYLNQLVKQLENSVKIDTREQPFNQTYVAKARLLLHSYLEHIEIQDPGLLQDQDAIVKYCPFLINEMMMILNQIWGYSKMYKGNKNIKRLPEPSLDMYESVMRLSQIVVQSLWLPFQPLLQLPHIKNDQLRLFTFKKKRINTIEEFSALKFDERRRLLKSLTLDECNDITIFCQQYPHIEMIVETEVPDDEDSKLISAGSLVTIKIFLKRHSLLEHFGSSAEQEISGNVNQNKPHLPEIDTPPLPLDDDKVPETLGTVEDIGTVDESNKSNSKSQQQQKKVGKKKGKSGGKIQKKKQQQNVRRRRPDIQKEDVDKKTEKEEQKLSESIKESGNESDQEDNVEDNLDDEEREWKELQKSVKKEQEQRKNMLIDSHLVHTPYFPADKHELWWAYVIDRKANMMIVPPEKVAGLKDEKEVNLRMIAEKKGTYKYTVVVTSDSYLNCSIQQDLKITVHEKKEVSGKEQWEDLEKEEEEEDVIEESVTEESDSNDSDAN